MIVNAIAQIVLGVLILIGVAAFQAWRRGALAPYKKQFKANWREWKNLFIIIIVLLEEIRKLQIWTI